MPAARPAVPRAARVTAPDALLQRIGRRFARPEPRRRARLYISGLLSGPDRKNGWTMAEYAGEADPNGMQRLLTSARWDVDGVRDDVRDWLLSRLGTRDGILVPTELAFPKTGTASVGVHRRYNDALGRSENVQVGLFLTYSGRNRWALLDRELYLPASWTADRRRCRALGVPDGVGFIGRPYLVRQMFTRALSAARPAPWIAADATYGDDRGLRAFLDGRDVRYVLATRQPVAGGPLAWEGDWGFDGTGLLARRTVAGLTWYHYRAAAGTPVRELARVAQAIGTAADRAARIGAELGLDRYQVRRYDAWYRHVTLCLVAGAYLADR